MPETECTFCSSAFRKNARMFYETDNTMAVLALNYLNHAIVIPKIHVLNASDMSAKEYIDFCLTYQLVEKALLETLNKNRAAVLRSGGIEQHLHWHAYALLWSDSFDYLQQLIRKDIGDTSNDSQKDELCQQLKMRLK